MSRNREHRTSTPSWTIPKGRRLSQNFLTDARQTHRLLSYVDTANVPLMIEIGPGKGALTHPLLDRVERLVAYEVDPDFCDLLNRRYGHLSHFTCHQRDIRDVRPPREPFSVVSNVPFHLTTDVVRWCLNARQLRQATLVTQFEFARKHSGDYGRWTKLSIHASPFATLRFRGRVSRRAFSPQPQADGGILHIERYNRPLLPRAQLGLFHGLVEIGFQGKGGSLFSSLTRRHSSRSVRSAFQDAGIPVKALVGQVSPEQWLALCRRLAQNP